MVWSERERRVATATRNDRRRLILVYVIETFFLREMMAECPFWKFQRQSESVLLSDTRVRIRPLCGRSYRVILTLG